MMGDINIISPQFIQHNNREWQYLAYLYSEATHAFSGQVTAEGGPTSFMTIHPAYIHL